jgi:hypothetical protein
MMKGFQHLHGSQQAFLQGCTTWSRISVRLSTPASVAWKWKAGAYPPQTECSTYKSSPLVACDER